MALTREVNSLVQDLPYTSPHSRRRSHFTELDERVNSTANGGFEDPLWYRSCPTSGHVDVPACR